MVDSKREKVRKTIATNITSLHPMMKSIGSDWVESFADTLESLIAEKYDPSSKDYQRRFKDMITLLRGKCGASQEQIAMGLCQFTISPAKILETMEQAKPAKPTPTQSAAPSETSTPRSSSPAPVETSAGTEEIPEGTISFSSMFPSSQAAADLASQVQPMYTVAPITAKTAKTSVAEVEKTSTPVPKTSAPLPTEQKPKEPEHPIKVVSASAAPKKVESQLSAVEQVPTTSDVPVSHKPTAKTNSGGLKSDYYFFKSTPKELAEAYRPKKIDPNGEVAATTQRATLKDEGCSAWNAGGKTWEERDLSSWAKTALRKQLTNETAVLTQGQFVKITEVTKCEGEANIVFVRGKKRAGFEFNLEAKFTGEVNCGASGLQGVSGTISVPCADESGDCEIDIRGIYKNSVAKEALAKFLQEQFDDFANLMRSQ